MSLITDNTIDRLCVSDKLSFTSRHTKLLEEHPKNLWRILSSERRNKIKEHGEFLPENYIRTALDIYKINDDVPSLDYLNDYFSDSGWSFAWNNGLNEEEFFYVCSKKIFPITTYSRGENELDRSVYPDFIHDLWGHIPMLSEEKMFLFLHKSSELFIKERYTGNDLIINKKISHNARVYKSVLDGENGYDEITVEKINYGSTEIGKKKLISRLILQFFEFGLLKSTNHKPIIVGGGILSSTKEINAFLSCNNFRRISMKTLSSHEYCLHSSQERYFYASNYDEIFSLLSLVEKK